MSNNLVELLVKKETTAGTPVVTDAAKMLFQNSSLGSTQSKSAQKLFDGSQFDSKPTRGVRTSSGDFVVPMQAEAFLIWAQLFAGHSPAAGGAGPYTYAITPAVTGPFPFTAEGKLDTGHYLLSKGTAINSLSFSPAADGEGLYSTLSMGAFDADQTQTSSLYGAATIRDETDLGADPQFEHYHASITGGTSIPTISGFTINIVNPLVFKQYLDGTPNAAKIIPDRYGATGTVTVEKSDFLTIVTKARAGTSDNLTLQLISGTDEFEVTLTNIDWDETALSMDANTVDQTVDIPFTSYDGFTINAQNGRASYTL